MECPGCGRVAKRTKLGWACLACPYDEKRTPYFHRCPDGERRFMPKGADRCAECDNPSSVDCPKKIEPLECPGCGVVGVHTQFGWYCRRCPQIPEHTAFYHGCARDCRGTAAFIEKFVGEGTRCAGCYRPVDVDFPFFA